MSQINPELLYTKDHEWARFENSIATIGITDHAQSALGDVVFVDLPKKGRILKRGEVFGVVESIKAVSDLYSPCDGEVLEVNSTAVSEPSLVNTSPYESAWLIKIKVDSVDGTKKQLLTADEYKNLLGSS